MNISHRFAIALGAIMLSLPTAGCSTTGGTTPMMAPLAPSLPATQRVGRAGHSSPKLYVSNIDGSVLVYSTGNEQLLQTITNGVSRPGGVWVDQRGVFYAVNLPDQYYQTSLPEYKRGATSPFRTITNGIVNCGNVAVDGKENVYVTGLNTENGSLFVEIYPKGKLSPSETLTIPDQGLSAVAGLAFDKTGALLVGEITEEGSSGAVYRLAYGSQNFTNLNLKKAPGGAIAVDTAGNMYVGGQNTVNVYAPNKTKASRKIYVPYDIAALTVEPGGRLYVGTGGGRVLVYAPGAKTSSQTLYVEALIGGLALSP